MIYKFRAFLIEHGILDAYCDCAITLGCNEYLTSWSSLIGGVFSWNEANLHLGKIIPWSSLDELWDITVSDSRPYCKPPQFTKELVDQLLHNKKRILLNSVKHFKG